MNFPKPKLSRDAAMKLWNEENSDYAKEQVVLNNIRMVRIVLKSLNLNPLDEDLFATGLLGLVKATANYDFNKGVKFSTFAATVIRNEILMTFRKKRINHLIYLDELVDLGNGDTVALMDMISDKRDYECEVISKISTENILKELTGRESQILRLYTDEGMTQAEIARQIGVSQPYVSRILGKIQKKLE